MGRPALEVADIFRKHGPAWRAAQHGHLSLGQLKVMSAIEQCRTAALGGHVLRCEGCGTDQLAYNSCRNRHCPKCQSSAAKRWLEARQDDLLPVEYFHVVFTLPAPIADLAYQNKAVVYGLLLDMAAEVLQAIAADAKHLGARIGATLVLHTWGSALTHHPHVHAVVPGGGLSSDGKEWVACRPGFFLPVRVLSRLFRRRFLEELLRVHQSGKLQFFGEHAALAEAKAFKAWLAPLRKCEWVVYARAPVRRAAGRAGLPVALHAPGGHFQQPAARTGRARRDLPLEGLSGQGRRHGCSRQDTPQDHDAGTRGVHASLPSARAARRLSSNPALRLAGQRQPQDQFGHGARAADANGTWRGTDQGRRRCRCLRTGTRSTLLRVPSLRPADDDPADPGARALDPRSTAMRRRTMSIERHHPCNQPPAALLARPVRSRMARSVCRTLDEPRRGTRASPDSPLGLPVGISQATLGATASPASERPRFQFAIAP